MEQNHRRIEPIIYKRLAEKLKYHSDINSIIRLEEARKVIQYYRITYDISINVFKEMEKLGFLEIMNQRKLKIK
jgi:hypothetical protein